MEGANYYYSRENFYEEPFSLFKLSLLSSRRLRREDKSLKCPLCEVIGKEICLEKLRSGGLFFNKYPVVDKSYLYISYRHKNLIDEADLADIKKITFADPSLILFSNVDGISSLPDHFHLECISSMYIPKIIIDKLKLSISGDVGITKNFYVDLIYFNIDNSTSLDSFFVFYKTLKDKGYKFNIVFFRNYLLIHILAKSLILQESIDCSARTLVGIFSTSNPEKFEYMRSRGLLKILKENTLPAPSLNKLFFEFVEGAG